MPGRKVNQGNQGKQEGGEQPTQRLQLPGGQATRKRATAPAFDLGGKPGEEVTATREQEKRRSRGGGGVRHKNEAPELSLLCGYNEVAHITTMSCPILTFDGDLE